MSNTSKTLEAIRTALGMEVKLATMKLEDGVTVIESENFEAGESVVIVTEDEQKIALPEGEYILEDERVLTVSEEGVIASIEDKKEEEAQEEEVAPEVEEEVAALESTDSTPATPKKIIESVSKESFFSSDILEAVSSLIDSKLETFKAELSTSEKVEDAVEETVEVSEDIVEETPEVELAEVKAIVPNPEAGKVEFKSEAKSLLGFLNNRK